MITKIFAWLHRKAIYNRTFKELSAMSDRELYDLGFTRSDIYSIAHEATYGVTNK